MFGHGVLQCKKVGWHYAVVAGLNESLTDRRSDLRIEADSEAAFVRFDARQTALKRKKKGSRKAGSPIVTTSRTLTISNGC
jgi:hypothetical protein